MQPVATYAMTCDHCGRATTPSYTLRTHLDDESHIELRFCSSDCLESWFGGTGASASTDRESAADAATAGGR